MPRDAGRTDVTRSAVLAHLGARGSTARADLARALGVSAAHITQITKRLLTEGLIVELEMAPSTGGRPGRLLGLASSAGTAIGAKVDSDHVSMVESGLDGAVVRAHTEAFDAVGATASSDLIDILRRFMAGSMSGPLLGVGVCVPGSVASQDVGTVDSTLLGWHSFHLGALLRNALAVPVLIENNVNALAVAELLFGAAREYSDVLVVTIGAGVGVGIIVDGTVIRGATGSAGEFGHTPVAPDGPLCQCGARGCLEALIGQNRLVARAQELSIIRPDHGFASLQQSATEGDTNACGLLREAGVLLGRSLAGVVNLIDPETVVVHGESAVTWQHWAPGFEAAFRAALIPRKRGIVVSVPAWQDDRWAQGAASLVLSTPFDTGGVAGEQGRLVREMIHARVRAGGSAS